MSDKNKTMQARLERKVMQALEPISFAIENESHKHNHHKSSPNTGESHFNMAITSQKFEGMSRVERQRLVYELCAEELKDGVHALSLRLSTP